MITTDCRATINGRIHIASSRNAPARARRQCDFGYSHTAFVVPDVDAVYEEIRKAGYRTVSPPQVLRDGRLKVVYVEEPEGAITDFVAWTAQP